MLGRSCFLRYEAGYKSCVTRRAVYGLGNYRSARAIPPTVEDMRPLVEAIHSLQTQELLVGKMTTQSEFLKLLIHCHDAGFDLYLTSTVDADKMRSGLPFRNTVGRDLASAEEVLETIYHLDAVYRVNIKELLQLPVWAREATPELIELIEQQLGRITSSTKTGEFAEGDLEATIVKVDGDGVIEVEPDDYEEDVKHLVLTDT